MRLICRFPACCLIILFAGLQSSCNKIYYQTNTTHRIRTDTLRKFIAEKKKFILHTPEFVTALDAVRLDSFFFSGDRQTLIRDYYHFIHPDTSRPNPIPHLLHKIKITDNQVHIYTDSSMTGRERLELPVSNINRMDVYKVVPQGRWRQGMGMNIFFQPLPGYRVVASVGFIYSPRVIFGEKERSYLSLGIPMTLAFSRLDDSNSVDLKLGILQDVPLIFNYNHTIGSGEKVSGRSGYFIGFGFGFHQNHYTAANDKGTITNQISGYGPVFNAGFRFVPNDERRGNLELRFSSMWLLESSHTLVYSLGFIANF